MSALLPSFRVDRAVVGGVSIHHAVGGDGPPVLLLHGYPQTHLMWHAVAPELAREHTVVVADLRGYGDSDKPAPGPDAAAYTKRAMAADQLALMRSLGFDRFDLVGHDRGGRVAHRLALDAPEAVRSLAVLDIVPTRHVFGHVDRALATAYWHWFFLPLANGIPERLIGADPDGFLTSMTAGLLGPGTAMDPRALAEYRRCFRDPAAIAASCADYRAAASLDLAHDEATHAEGGRLRCPTLVLWGERGFVGRRYDPPAVWREYVADPGSLSGAALPVGHFLPEEDPRGVLAALGGFLAGRRG